eukprot:CAMPEP_0170277960 /NCGR_PEP_ID=MMETSP0116_2-20130129/38979_1 /TAXON_ID=400756 /ORGANISM="Durinskia baltica, Strain CSIRO CS-38" /LENGTH=70 /DNA_ID=CAMNT_0010529261 /DNA_START=7 /DNA_END=217 /DNA_ORIENTATION=+
MTHGKHAQQRQQPTKRGFMAKPRRGVENDGPKDEGSVRVAHALEAGEEGVAPELLFDAEQLVVLGEALAA